MFEEDIEGLLGENDDLINNPKAPEGNDRVFEELLPDDLGNDVVWEGKEQLGGLGYGESQFDEGATAKQIREGGLGERRANMQPWTDQLGNMIGQAVVGEVVGGTIEGVGYLLDIGDAANYASGEEKKWGNFLTEIGQSIREGSEENMRIYEEKPGEMNMSDPGYWFKNGVSVASSLSMLVPSIGATRALGFLGKTVSKGAGMLNKSLDIAAQMGIKSTWMAEGISQAVVSRHIENSMEAHGTFEDQKSKLLNEVDPSTKELYTDKEATRIASEAAAYNYRHGWAMLLQDIPQYLALGRVFNPATMKMENALNKAVKAGATPKWQSAAKASAGTFFSEGAEEGYQFYIAEKGKLLSDLKAGLISQDEYDSKISEVMNSDEAATSMLFGGLGGNLFQLAGKGANELFKSKSRKELESSAAESYNAGLKTRSKQIAALQQQLYKADQSQNEEYRADALNSLMTQTIIEAISNDKLDATIEAITNGPKMSEEELAAFEKEHGFEYNPELAKKYTPQVLENAERIRKMHYRNLNKASNKGAHKSIIEAMTMNEFQSQESLKNIQNLDQEYNQILDDSPFSARNPSAYLNRKSRLEVNKEAVKGVIAYTKKALKNAKDDRLKKQYEGIIKDHEKGLAEYEKEINNLDDDKKSRSKEEVISDSKASKAFKNLKEDLVTNRAKAMFLEDFITRNQDDLELLNNKNHRKKLVADSILSRIKDIETTKDVDQAIADFSKNKDYEGTPEGKEILGALQERKDKIIKDEKLAQAEASKAAYEAEKEAQKEADKKDPTKPDNASREPIDDSIEDENAGEEIDFTEKQLEEDAKSDLIKASGGRSISLLDGVSGTKNFQEWKQDGSDKIGTKVTYARSNRGARTPERNRIIKMFNENKDSDQMPQEVYDKFPIIAYIGEGKQIFTFLPAKPEGPQWKIDMYEQSYAAERKNIVDRIAKGETVTSEVMHTSGGELITQNDESGYPVENSVMSLRQISSEDDVDLSYSDENGKLVNVSTKEQNRYFAGKQMQVAPGQPYRGGLFLTLNKADGKKFPVRLNFQKNTQEQAEVLADILTEIAVPDQKGQEKNVKLSQPLDTLTEELQNRIKTVMSPELEVIGKNPTMKDLINMFVYVSEKTKNMSSRLYWSGENLNYGDNNAVTPGNKSIRAEKDKLVNFLTNTKRRQFSIDMWNSNPKYRKFVLESGLINTNVISGEPEFQTTDNTYTSPDGKEYQYRIQTYVKPLAAEKSDPVEKVSLDTGKRIISSALQERIDRTKKVGMQINENGKPYAPFYIRKFGQLVAKEMNSMEEVMAEYQKEINKMPLATKKKADVIPNTPDQEVKETVSDNIWNKFVDTGKVDPNVLSLIKNKIKRGDKLSPRANAIYKNDASSIEADLIADSKADDTQILDTEVNDVSSPNPRRKKRKIKPAVKFKNNNLMGQKEVTKKDTINNKSEIPFNNDEPGKIDKNCK